MSIVRSHLSHAAVHHRSERVGIAVDSAAAESPSPAPRRRWRAQLSRRQIGIVLVVVLLNAGMVALYLTRDQWAPSVGRLLALASERLEGDTGHVEAVPGAESDDPEHEHAEGAAGAEANSLVLSRQGEKNVGLRLASIELRDFDRTINVPALVTERSGRTQIKVSAPMTGVVTRVYPIGGEAVTPGQPLFDLLLTHEDLVNTQSEFLETLEKLDVINREVARLTEVTSSGAVAGKQLLEREYEQQQAEASLRAQEQAMLLHGITAEQIQQIKATRKLVQQVTIYAPQGVDQPVDNMQEPLLQVSAIEVAPGQHVQAGEVLGVLSDHGLLYIAGKAFEEDSGELNAAANQGAPVTAVIEANGNGPHTVSGLKILYIENEVDVQSRALNFYVHLPNELVRNERTEDGHRFIGWRFKPGQRVQLHVPVERWQDRIVLPIEAVVNEGPEWFVFQQNGARFDRKSVHVEYRDPRWAVIENDGSLFPGDVVAVSGAYQMHLAMKNRAGGGADPHAGHNH